MLLSCKNDNYEIEDKKVDDLIINFVKENSIPGLSLTVIDKDGDIRYSKGFGFADLKKNLK